MIVCIALQLTFHVTYQFRLRLVQELVSYRPQRGCYGLVAFIWCEWVTTTKPRLRPNIALLLAPLLIPLEASMFAV